jgi:hypothetical protein
MAAIRDISNGAICWFEWNTARLFLAVGGYWLGEVASDVTSELDRLPAGGLGVLVLASAPWIT